MQLETVSALVAGGARGLGEATVRSLIAAGARCVILDTDVSAGSALSEGLGELATFVPGDITSDDDVQRAIDATIGRPLRLAVNCAFVAHPEPVLSSDGVAASLEKFRKVIEVNLTGTYNVLRLVAQHMARQPREADGQSGVFVGTSSTSGFDGGAPQTAYSVSKAAVAALTLPAARDLAPHGIRVMAIAPGPFATPPVAGLPDAYRTALINLMPHPQRLGAPDEFARLVVHIFENAFLNGDTIRLDGASRIGFVKSAT